MPAVTLDKEMSSYFTQLNDAEKESVVQMLKTFLQGKKENIGISIEQYNSELEAAMKRIDEGIFITHEALEKEMASW